MQKTLIDSQARMKVMDVTPKQAAKWLSNNPNNRNIKPHHVTRLAADMLAGNWVLNGDCIRLNCDGRLMDGQNRLAAVVKSGVTIRTYVLTGLPDTAMNSLGGNSPRSLSDSLKILGKKDCVRLAAALQFLWKWKHKTLQNNDAAMRPTFTQATDLLRRNGGLAGSVSLCNNVAHRGFGIGAFLAFLHYVAHQKSPAKADSFIDCLESGVGLTKNHPVLLLREILNSDRAAIRPMKTKHKHALVVKAWNKHLAGERIRTLRWSGFNENPEAFPEIRL